MARVCECEKPSRSWNEPLRQRWQQPVFLHFLACCPLRQATFPPRGQPPHPPSTARRNRLLSGSYQKSPRTEAHRTILSPVPIPEIIAVSRRQTEGHLNAGCVSLPTACVPEGGTSPKENEGSSHRRKRNGRQAGNIRCPLVIESDLTRVGHTCDIYSSRVMDFALPLHTAIPYE